jgi:hypothetical protein
VLQVDGGDDGDAAVQQFLKVLPTLAVAAAGRIIVSQFVDQADFRMPAEKRNQVHGAIYQGNDFEAGNDPGHVRRDIALYGADDHILAAFLAAAALVEHAERLADARGVAQEDLEAAPLFAALFGLDAAQQFFGVGPAINQMWLPGLFWHAVQRQIQLQHIDPSLTENAPLAVFGVSGYQLAHGVYRHFAGGGYPVDLGFGGGWT